MMQYNPSAPCYYPNPAPSMIGSHSTLKPLFVGDLSKFCREYDLLRLFGNIGPVQGAEIKKSKRDGTSLCYGFVYMANYDDAMRAIDLLNGQVIGGRAIKVRWGVRKSEMSIDESSQQLHHNDSNINSLFVHFQAQQLGLIVTEETLVNLFQNYGRVHDASIKTSEIDPKTGLQSGYGFVHFESTTDGFRSAYECIQKLHHVVIDAVQYQCEPSKNLLKSLYQSNMDYIDTHVGSRLHQSAVGLTMGRGVVLNPMSLQQHQQHQHQQATRPRSASYGPPSVSMPMSMSVPSFPQPMGFSPNTSHISMMDIPIAHPPSHPMNPHSRYHPTAPLSSGIGLSAAAGPSSLFNHYSRGSSSSSAIPLSHSLPSSTSLSSASFHSSNAFSISSPEISPLSISSDTARRMSDETMFFPAKNDYGLGAIGVGVGSAPSLLFSESTFAFK